MTSTLRDDAFEEGFLVRVVVATAVVIVAALMVVNFVQARNRSDPVIGRTGSDGGVAELVVTADTDSGLFADTVVWWLPSERVELAAVDGVPLLGLPTPGTGTLVGLRGPDGIVALSIVPVGLDDRPDELLVSATSTALAIAALHPELMSADLDTHLASMVSISQTASFPDLVARVDGRALISWGADDLDVLRRVVAEARLPVAQSTCAEPESLEGPATGEEVEPAVSWCPDAGRLENPTSRTVFVFGDDGEPCAVVPARTGQVPAAGLDRLLEITARGAVPAARVPPIGLRPGIAEQFDCAGTVPAAATDRDQLDQSRALSLVADVAVPLARLLGASPELRVTAPEAPTLALVGEIAVAGSPVSDADRAVAAARFVRSAQGAAELDLLPPTAETVERLDDLIELFGVLYA